MITRFCIIRNKTIICDGKKVLDGKFSSLEDFLSSAYDFLKPGYPKFYKMDNLSKLGFLAAEFIFQNRNISNEYTSENIALVLSNANSSLDTDIRFSESTKTIASPGLFVYTLPNIVAGEICIRHKIKGENAFFISSKFDPALLSEYVSMVIPDAQPPIPNAQSLIPNAQSLIPNAQPPISNAQPLIPKSACLAGWVDVMGEQHDVFLYLIEKDKPGLFEHSADQLKALYNTEYGTING